MTPPAVITLGAALWAVGLGWLGLRLEAAWKAAGFAARAEGAGVIEEQAAKA